MNKPTRKDRVRRGPAQRTQHTCNVNDRREGQLDADCSRCQQIMARRQQAGQGRCRVTTHTPGPWRVEGRDIRAGAENLIAQVARQTDNNGGDDPIRNANARLIAAAPRMFDALKEIAGLSGHGAALAVEIVREIEEGK